jgi:type I restriction enzyme, S subunit
MSLASYPAYKPSGVAWLGDVPAHWELKRLRFIAQLNPSKSEVAELDKSTEVSFLPMECIGEDGSIVLEQTRMISQVETGYTFFKDGDVTIAKITPCFENGKGAVMQGLLESIGFGTTELVVVRPIVNHSTSHFLHYLFVSPFFRKTGEGAMYGAGGQKRISDDFVRNFATAVPPVEEQTTIAQFLDFETGKIDALIAEQERLIALLAEKRQATISHAVTKGLNPHAPMKPSGVAWLGDVPKHWEVKAIKRLSPVQRGASPRPIEDPKFFDDDGEYAWVRISDVSSSNGILYETTQRLSSLGSSLSVKINPKEIFISIAGTVGKPCISAIKACIHDGFVYFPQLKIPPIFLYRIFEAGVCYAGLGKFGTQLNLNTETIGNIKIALPPAGELNELINFIDDAINDIDTLQAEAHSTIALLKERRTALISAAVTGKIDVRGFAVPPHGAGL